TAFTGIAPTEIVGSENANGASPKFCVRIVLMADRSSVMSAAPMRLVPAVGVGFVKVAEKFAFTDCTPVMTIVHGPEPLQLPFHQLNDAPEPALAASVTVVPVG